MYAIVVDFEINPDHMDSFLPKMQENARTSLAQEEACLQFDVLTDPDRPSSVMLYELYASQAAFQAHLNTAHFKRFDAAVGPMITSKTVRSFSQVSQ